jgi:hypothetical protein
MESLVRKNGGFFVYTNPIERLHYPDSRTSPRIQRANLNSRNLHLFSVTGYLYYSIEVE